MKRLVRYLGLFGKNIEIELHRFSQYKVNYILDFFSSLIFIITNLLFWKSIYGNNYSIPYWDSKQIIVFTAYVELFFGIKNGLFSGSSNFWIYIVTGKIDTYLVRPLSVIIKISISNIRIFEVCKGFILFVSLLILSNLKLNLISVFGGVIICCLGAFMLSLIQLCVSFISFKYGKVDALVEIIDSLMNFNKYPLNIMPNFVYSFFKYLIPFAYFSTIPAIISLNNSKSINLIITFFISIIITLVWIFITDFFWERSLKHYEGYNS